MEFSMKTKLVSQEGSLWYHVEPSDGKGFYRVKIGSRRTKFGFIPIDGYFVGNLDSDIIQKFFKGQENGE